MTYYELLCIVLSTTVVSDTEDGIRLYTLLMRGEKYIHICMYIYMNITWQDILPFVIMLDLEDSMQNKRRQTPKGKSHNICLHAEFQNQGVKHRDIKLKNTCQRWKAKRKWGDV